MIKVIADKLSTLGPPVTIGVPDSHTEPPFIVVRPSSTTMGGVAVGGCPITWDSRVVVFVLTNSAYTSDLLAKTVQKELTGVISTPEGNVSLVADSVYSGEFMDGLYESQIQVYFTTNTI